MEIYHCKNCGSVMEFDPESQALKCPSCGSRETIDHFAERIQEHPMTLDARRKIRAEEKTSHTMECQGCGAKIEVDANSTAAECPYCGSKYVLAEKQEDTLVPDGVLPFQLDRDMADQRFAAWVKGQFWAPGKLKHLYQKGLLQGIYLPYWTFDARTDTPYTARGGRVHTQTYRGPNGKMRTRTYTTWHPVSGQIRHTFDDLLVPASGKLDLDLLGGMDSFRTEALVSYSPEYLSGYNAECFSVSLEVAANQARQEMTEQIREMAEREVLSRYDRIDGLCISPSFSGETFKYILVPVYSTAYQYRDRVYHVLINGQSGLIAGEYPKSIFKIALCVLLVIAVILLVFYFLQ